ncbi:unnamed protein product [Rotaria sordida]|uniref:Uncharacterized protein n=1 Tax=Rotaria sordida TaxID=392033 RepID=A0A815GEA1_9BILA|nr:unnamed protein product [Rotaria sordida]
MIRLNKITFNIRSIILRGNQIISCINYFPKTNECHCYIYSYSYTLTYYNDITNNFPGGLFKCVRKVSLYDECPFEYEFFLQIAQSFPFMKKLTVHKRKSQNNDNQQWSIIECFHLTELDLVRTHENYIEEFIINNKTHLLNNVTLHITYKSSQRITHNFTGDATRINCSKIDYIVLYSKPEFFFLNI